MTTYDSSLNFRTKSISFEGRNVRILLQRQHGPCPLLALTNCLLLRNDLSIPNDMDIVEDEYLISLLRQILKEKYKNETDEKQLEKINECIKALPRLLRGLDVNLSFGDIEHFEETIEYSSFQLMDVRLLHGWLVDPEDIDLYEIVSKLTYDEATSLATQAPNIIVASENDLSTMKQYERDGYLCRLWIESTGHVQMTEHGLSKLYTNLQNNEVVAFYRNHHFFTLAKYDHSLFLLINDDALAECHDVVWESMIEVDHRGEYHDSFFNSLSNAARKRVKRARLVEQQRQLLLQYERAHKRKSSSPKITSDNKPKQNSNGTGDMNFDENNNDNNNKQMKNDMKNENNAYNVEDNVNEKKSRSNSASVASNSVSVSSTGCIDKSVQVSNQHKRTSSNNSQTEIIIEDINPQLKSSHLTSSQSSSIISPTENRTRSIVAKISPNVVFDNDRNRELKLDLPSMDDNFTTEIKFDESNDDNSGTDLGLLEDKKNLNSRDILLDDIATHIMKNTNHMHRESFGPSVALQRHRMNFSKDEGNTQRFQLDRTLTCLLLLLLIFISLIVYAIVSFNT